MQLRCGVGLPTWRPISAPLVSVIIPTRDRADRVLGAIESVQAQTYDRLEILVIDDASSDTTEAVVAEAARSDARIRYLRLDSVKGGAGARNHGLDHARGRVVAFLDDDDRWFPGKVEQQLAAVEQDPAVGLVSCHHELLDETSGRDAVTFRGPTECTYQDLLWSNFAGSTSFCMLGPRMVERGLRFDETFPAFHDWELWLRCAREAPVIVAPAALCRFTEHRGPRITVPERQAIGWDLVCERYGRDMSQPCQEYHRAQQVMVGESGARRKARIAWQLATRTKTSTWTLALAQWTVTQAGDRRGDPGRGARWLHARSRRLDGRR